jgi:hypothetical protein
MSFGMGATSAFIYIRGEYRTEYEVLVAALEQARARGVPRAAEALAEVEERGARTGIARAIVRRLGEQLAVRARGDPLKMGFKPWPPAGFDGA